MGKRLSPDDFEPHSFTTQFNLDDFKCQDKAFEKYLKKEAQVDHNTNIGRVFLMVEKKTKRVVGFVTLAMGHLPKKEGVDGKPSTRYATIPGLLLGQLAAHKEYKGMGTLLLDFVINHALELSQKVGCRIIYVHSVKGKELWYEKNGFTLVKDTERTFFMDLFLDEPEKY